MDQLSFRNLPLCMWIIPFIFYPTTEFTATAFSIQSHKLLSKKSRCSLNRNSNNNNQSRLDRASRPLNLSAVGVRRKIFGTRNHPKLQSMIQGTKNNYNDEIADMADIQEEKLPTNHETDNDDGELVQCYLGRIGFSNEEIISFTEKNHHPTIQHLQRLLSAHLLHVPFENMDLHTHASQIITSEDGNNGKDDTRKSSSVPEIKRKKNLPSLDVNRSLNKIIKQNRGGFCYEVNLSFCWLLRRLGFRVRLAVADVSCKQEIPAHVVILVDGLKYNDDNSMHKGSGMIGTGMDLENNNIHRQNIPILVDVGFGCPGVCDVILPLKYGKIYSDLHGDTFRFDKTQSHFPLHEGRFNTVLYRTRVNANVDSSSSDKGGEEPMYRFHSKDNLDDDASEFQRGLEYVLTTSPTFNEKRLCVISTNKGHITLGSNYVKWVERWKVVKQKNFTNEEGWRKALLDYFGVRLVTEE